ncbi:MAG: hypothetical protein KJ057_13880 [Phycisphaerae bacterium]|nr:hypothetical protein [Planctomycetia bacterium]MCL4719555.1 hypothetical protein [Phycisphaerae bacterium]
MIRSDDEYRATSGRVAAAERRIREQEERLRSAGLSAAEIKRVIDPLKSFHQQLKEEVEEYERRLA